MKYKIIGDQERLVSETHKDRLTILGRMTSSFVHECRNPLTSVMGFMQLLKAENPNMKYMDIIQRELEQLEYRISQFLLLSKKEVVGKKKKKFSMNKLLVVILLVLVSCNNKQQNSDSEIRFAITIQTQFFNASFF